MDRRTKNWKEISLHTGVKPQIPKVVLKAQDGYKTLNPQLIRQTINARTSGGHKRSMVASGGGERPLAEEHVIEHLALAYVVALVVDL